MGFKVSVFCHFFVVEGRWGEHIEIFQAAALQQFGNRTLQRYAEIRVRAEGGEAGTVGWVEQHHADNRIFTA